MSYSYDSAWPSREAWAQCQKPHRCASDGACSHPEAWGPWLPYRPLADAAGGPHLNEMAVLAAVSVRTVHRWVDRNAIPVRYADRCAVALALHPMNVWGDDWSFVTVQSSAWLSRIRRTASARRAAQTAAGLPDQPPLKVIEMAHTSEAR